jgi:hypothetical protein
LVAYVLGQILVVWVQRRYGARAIVPARWRPAQVGGAAARARALHGVVVCERVARVQYDYFREIDDETLSRQCAVCLNNVEAHDRHMITPCQHVYHRACLLRWMQQKSACPVCRSSLPDL